MADPASLNVALTITGLANDEATVAFNNLPVGSTATVQVTKPAIGSKRYAIAAERLSVQGAKDVVTSVFLHCQQVADAPTHPDGCPCMICSLARPAGGESRG